jgi:hypothetical protein
MKLKAVAVAGVLVVATAAPVLRGQAAPSRAQADAFQRKLAEIVQHGESAGTRPRRTTVTEAEVNAYLRFDAGEQLPTGVTDPSITIQREGLLSGRAIVDLDAVRRKKGSGGWLDPTSYLTGRLPVTATGVLRTGEGRGRFQLDTAAVSGIPVPKMFLQELVWFYTRTADLPNGINIDDPFDLPAAIERIDVQPGRAIIVQ